MTSIYLKYKDGDYYYVNSLYEVHDLNLLTDGNNLYILDIKNLKIVVIPESKINKLDVEELTIVNDPPLDQQGKGEI